MVNKQTIIFAWALPVQKDTHMKTNNIAYNISYHYGKNPKE